MPTAAFTVCLENGKRNKRNYICSTTSPRSAVVSSSWKHAVFTCFVLFIYLFIFFPYSCFQFFDKVDILDPRLPDFCSKTTLPNPSQILEECLKR